MAIRKTTVNLLSKNGNLETFENVTKIIVQGMKENEIVPTDKVFLWNGNRVQKTVDALDFSGGSTQNYVTAESEDESFYEVIIYRPAYLAAQNIKKGITIAGITGTFEGEVISGREALLEFGDAAGAGCVISSPDRLELRVYSPRSAISFADAGFEQLLNDMKTGLTPVSAMLETYAQQIMGIYASKFSDVFVGAEKALFFDEKHPCDIPEFLSSDAKTWAGLIDALLRSYSGQSWNSYLSNLFLNPDDCIKWYGTQKNENNFSAGDKGKFLYTWFPGVADGAPVVTGYNLQEPTGDMPTWDGGYKVYAGETSASACGCFNIIPAYGVTSQFFILFIAGHNSIAIRSDAAQTLSETFLQQFNAGWHYGDISATAGWSVTSVDTSTGEAITESLQVGVLQQIIASGGGIPVDSLPFDTMDAYTKSYFMEILTQQYKKLNDKSFTLEFNLEGVEN